EPPPLIAADADRLPDAPFLRDPYAAAGEAFSGKGDTVLLEIAKQFRSPFARSEVAVALGDRADRLGRELERIVALHGFPRGLVLVAGAEAAGEGQCGGVGAVQ